MNDSPSRGSVAKDVFLYLLMIGTLYVSIGTFLVLVFQFINELFPDALTYSFGANEEAMRSAMAALIIVFPVYILSSWLILREMRFAPEKTDLRIRKWLLYLTLFLSAVTIIVDLVTLVYSLLYGDLTIRFFLKVLAVFAVAGGVFWYYLWDVRRHDTAEHKIPRAFGIASGVIVLAGVIAGFFVLGSPFYQRQVRFDQRRANDLQNIQSEVVSFWQRKNALPQSQDALRDDISGFRAPLDPATNAPYEYRVTGNLSFELCATFATKQPETGEERGSRPYYGFDQTWDHEAGRTCFQRTIDPELYKREGIYFRDVPPPAKPVPLPN